MAQPRSSPKHPRPASGVAAADDAAPATVRRGLAARAVRAVIRGYQLLFSAWVGGQCRFYPTCSAYAMEAVDQHGAAAGSYLMVARLCRCQPWCEGGLDPVPAQPPRLFRHLAGPSSRQTRSEEVRP